MEQMVKKALDIHLEMIRLRFDVQRLRLIHYWEPRLVRELTSMADQGEALLADAVAIATQTHGQLDGAQLRNLKEGLSALAREKGTQAKATLEEYVRLESWAAYNILLDLSQIRQRKELKLSQEELAAGPAVDEAVGNALAEFTQGVTETLGALVTSGGDAEKAREALSKLARNWRNRLKTVAVTIMHAVNNRTKVALVKAVNG